MWAVPNKVIFCSSLFFVAHYYYYYHHHHHHHYYIFVVCGLAASIMSDNSLQNLSSYSIMGPSQWQGFKWPNPLYFLYFVNLPITPGLHFLYCSYI